MTSFGSDECQYVYNNSDPNLQCRCDREGKLLNVCVDHVLLEDVQVSCAAIARMGKELVFCSINV